MHTHTTHGEVSEDGLLAVHEGHQDETFCMILTFYTLIINLQRIFEPKNTFSVHSGCAQLSD